MAESAERATAKAGWKTTEFWITAGAMIIPQAIDALPPTWKAIVSAAAGAIYTLARTLAKYGIGGGKR